MFSTTDLRKLFNVRRQTISNWCIEFARYLSPTADRTGNAHRKFTEDDVRVLATVHELRGQGLLYESIHLALQSGQRAEFPDAPNSALSLEVNQQLGRMQTRILQLEAQIDDLEDERIQLERDKLDALSRERKVTEMYERLQSEISMLNREIGRLESQIPRKPND